MSTTTNIQPTSQFTGVTEQKKLDNSATNAPGIPQQQRFENIGSEPTATGTQQVRQGQEGQPGYLQQAYDGVSNLLNTAASALPVGTTTATGTRGNEDTTPALHAAARRIKQQHGPTGGVGSLPGTPNEEDVVRLPEERQHPDPLAEERERHSMMQQPPMEGRLDDATQKAAFAAAAPAGAGTHPHTTGGSAVGSNFDHHHGLGMEHSRKAGEGVHPVGTGIRPLPDQPGYGASTTTHDSSTTHPPRDTLRGTGGHTKEAVKDTVHRTTGDHSVTSHPTTDPHPPRDTLRSTGAHAKEEVKDTAHMSTDPHDEASPTGTTKPTFMERMKGQTKIISGKMTKDAEKVEEGKAMKSPH